MSEAPATASRWLRRLLRRSEDGALSRAERAQRDAERWLEWREEQFSRRLEQRDQVDEPAAEQD